MTITKLSLQRFTAFSSLELRPVPKINVFVGNNGTGKTHLLKLLYAACAISEGAQTFPDKLTGVFLPRDRAIGRLVRRAPKSQTASIEVWRDTLRLSCRFSNHTTAHTKKRPQVLGARAWQERPISSVYIPVKELLSNAPGLRGLAAKRELHIEDVYIDIIDRALIPALRGPKDKTHTHRLQILRSALEGKVIAKGEVFYLKNKQGELEFTLLAEGLRKLGLLWLLIQNGVLSSGSVMFWDEPEAKLSPTMFSVIAQILLSLADSGVQIFVATHDYAILKELQLATDDGVRYFGLHRQDRVDGVQIEEADSPFQLEHNPIAAAMDELYDRQIRASLGSPA